MKKIVLTVILCIATIFTFGCTKQGNTELQNQYDALLEEKNNIESSYQTLVSENEHLQSDYEESQTKYEELETQYEELLASDEETTTEQEEPEDLSEYSTEITYDNLARTPDDYVGKEVSMKGEVIQVMESEEEIDLRVAIDDDYDQVVLLVYDPAIMSERVLENDEITFYGISYGIITYESTMGSMISVPAIYADSIEIQK